MFTNLPGLDHRKGMGTVPCGFPGRQGLIFAPVSMEAPKPPAVVGRTVEARAFPPLSGVDKFQRGTKMTKKIDIAAIPELSTSVGMHGSVKQKEVAGPLCLGIMIAIILGI